MTPNCSRQSYDRNALGLKLAWGGGWEANFILTKFIYFNWRIIILQYCDGFCHTST